MRSEEGTALTFCSLNTAAESDCWENPSNSASLVELRETFLGVFLLFQLLWVLLNPDCFQMEAGQEEKYSQGESCVYLVNAKQDRRVSHTAVMSHASDHHYVT